MPFGKKTGFNDTQKRDDEIPNSNTAQKDKSFLNRKKYAVDKVTRAYRDKRYLNETIKRRVCKCSTCELLRKNNDGGDNKNSSKYEIINIVDENSIYSPEHVLENKEFGLRIGQLYVKADLIEEMLKETFRNVQ